MSADPFRFVSTNRRVREDRRFVAGHGHFVADVALEGMLHVAILPSQHPAARIVSIDASAALAMPGVHYVLTGDELAAATDPLMNGLDTPKVRRHPLAVGQARYAGEWVAAVVAETRPLAEDATEKVRVTYEPLPFVLSAEEALRTDRPCIRRMVPTCCSTGLLCGVRSRSISLIARAICHSASPGDVALPSLSKPLALPHRGITGAKCWTFG